MSNFLRGGQVTTHKLRMTMQVIRVITRFALIIMLFTIFMTFKNNITSYEWRMVPVVIKKYVYQDLAPSKIITYTNKWGRECSERINYLKYSRELQYVEDKFYHVWLLTLKRLVWVTAFSLIFSMLFFWYRGMYLNSTKQMRGSQLISGNDLKNLIAKHNRQFGLRSVDQYFLAGVPYAATGKDQNYTPGEQAHTLILGATGSGKTKVMQALVDQIKNKQSKAIIIDIKGDYIRHFYDETRGDIILNPLDRRGVNWSFFKETNALKGFDTIATTLMPDAGRDPFWVNAARLIFSEFAKLYVNQDITLSEFADRLLNSDISKLEKALSNTKAQHLVNQKADKTVVCVLMMLAIYLSPFKLYNKKEEVFSISDWVRDTTQNNFLFISTSSDVKASLNGLVQMQIDIAINALCSSIAIVSSESNKQDNKEHQQNQQHQQNKQHVWFILDELAYFDRGISNLKDGLTMSRSFGGAFVLGAQDMSSLAKIYGHDLSRVIANNCRNKFVMNVDDSYTAKWCSELFGEGEIEEWNEGLSYGAHEMRDGVSSNKSNRIKRTILPSEFAQLKTGAGYIRIPGFNPALISSQTLNVPDKCPSFIEDTSLKQTLEQEIKVVESKKLELDNKLGNEIDNISTKVIEDTSDILPENRHKQTEPSF